MSKRKCKNSFTSLEKNRDKWTKSLTKFQNSLNTRRNITIRTDSLETLCKIPKESTIIGRYLALAKMEKSRWNRIKFIEKEVFALWKNFNLPLLSQRSVQRKIEVVIEKYDKFLKHQTRNINEEFNNIFDVTKGDGEWLCNEDQKFYQLQVTSNGKVGYATMKEAKMKSIHPSKRIKKLLPCSSTSGLLEANLNSDTDSIQSNNSSNDEFMYKPAYSNTNNSFEISQKTSSGVKLVTEAALSTRKAAKVCKILYSDGNVVQTPTQQGIYKALYKKSLNFRSECIQSLKNEYWSLHFDGKLIDKKEYQVIVLKNAVREIRLSVLALSNGKSVTISQGIKNILTEYELWNAVKMIVSDTTSGNTGRTNGVVVTLQREFQKLGIDPPVYIGCQHHILDRLLKHVMDQIYEDTTTSPNLHYPFVMDVVENYDSLKENIQNSNILVTEQAEGWRDDMRFLFHLTRVFRYYIANNNFLKVNFMSLPGLSNARWNSRAIFAFLAFILIPKYRASLDEICTFVSNTWCDIWFGKQLYNEEDYKNLEEAVKNYPKATLS